MNRSTITQSLSEMRENYLEKKSISGIAGDKIPSRKMVKIKKRLVNLERERCQKVFCNGDASQNDEKIEQQKKLYSKCCSK